MKSNRPRRPSASLVISIVALVLAAGGSATAATAVINSGQIKNNTIRSKDLANGKAVSVKDLTKKARSALRGAKGAKGDTGPQGPQGLQGLQGATGGLQNVVTRVEIGDLDDGAADATTATCDAGERLVGGGVQIGNTDTNTTDLRLTSSRPTSDATTGSPADGATPVGWRGVTYNIAAGQHGDNIAVRVYALCAS